MERRKEDRQLFNVIIDQIWRTSHPINPFAIRDLIVITYLPFIIKFLKRERSCSYYVLGLEN